ncbi:hypothetical protein [Parerythrobacter lacustris]|uniref:Uncharacterized protein n=1 Tax=Parerythrobacter lacustris TaxID=2969984 RepID=A0ABT1XQZ6_9SPHN|nr:hypothetical protein [Parerythrobacter lacustris]MCR2834084.1 hypothetical protein [Parerythrobacter lacustris]
MALFARSAWRDPDNWRIDPHGKRLKFNHWKELALVALMGLLGLVLYLTIF